MTHCNPALPRDSDDGSHVWHVNGLYCIRCGVFKADMSAKSLINRIRDYAEGRIALTDDPEVYEMIMNLPIVKELQRRDNQFRCDAQNMSEAMRFLQSTGDSFCVMWRNFKESVGKSRE